MQTVDVTVGQRVTAGQRIAGVGSEGFSTGPHCHFEVYPDGVNAIDPVGWLADRGIAVA
jgi:murein DD-endopeptidase MepM/ murein hydrolase activator NlpD